MRELTVRIRFIKHCIGNVKAKDKSGRFLLPRGPSGQVTFMPSWHRTNLMFAARILNRHQDEVDKILWDIHVDASVRPDSWYHRYYLGQKNKRRYCVHESFVPGQIVGINCVVPSAISDEDFWELMRLAGQYRGLSPMRPKEYGLFEVMSIRPRRQSQAAEETDTGAVA